jgi:hypothetical protein
VNKLNSEFLLIIMRYKADDMKSRSFTLFSVFSTSRISINRQWLYFGSRKEFMKKTECKTSGI